MIQQEGGRILWETRSGRSAPECCTLACYRELVRGLPRPTAAQIDAYVEYVSGAHSWYKHLPFFPPGLPYFFYLEPTAGADRLVHSDGSITVNERTANSQGGHYNLRTTVAYRSEFGHLAYGGYRCASAEERSPGSEVDGGILPIFIAPDAAYLIPEEIAAVGGVRLLATVHDNGLSALTFAQILPRIALQAANLLRTRYWEPHEGDTLALLRLRQIFDPRGASSSEDHQEMEALRLVTSERLRQRAEMADAIRRMLALAYEDNIDPLAAAPARLA